MIPFPRKGSKGSEASQDSQGFPIVPLSKAVISTDGIGAKYHKKIQATMLDKSGEIWCLFQSSR